MFVNTTDIAINIIIKEYFKTFLVLSGSEVERYSLTKKCSFS